MESQEASTHCHVCSQGLQGWEKISKFHYLLVVCHVVVVDVAVAVDERNDCVVVVVIVVNVTVLVVSVAAVAVSFDNVPVTRRESSM